MEGLFGDADAGAFGGRKDDEDSAMLADEDGDVFWDAVEGPYSEPMDEDGYGLHFSLLVFFVLKKKKSSSFLGSFIA